MTDIWPTKVLLFLSFSWSWMCKAITWCMYVSCVLHNVVCNFKQVMSALFKHICLVLIMSERSDRHHLSCHDCMKGKVIWSELFTAVVFTTVYTVISTYIWAGVPVAAGLGLVYGVLCFFACFFLPMAILLHYLVNGICEHVALAYMIHATEGSCCELGF